jgi:glutathione S-transferase
VRRSTVRRPAGRYERAQILAWQFFEQYEIEPNLAVARFFKRFDITPSEETLKSKHVAGEGGFSLAGYPSILTWLDRVAAPPGHIAIDA